MHEQKVQFISDEENIQYNIYYYIKMIPQPISTVSVPPQLQYSQIWPKGFYSSFKEVRLMPNHSSEGYWAGQIIRILFQSMSTSTSVFDPYRSHIQIQVQMVDELSPVGLLQVDNSAQSFIEQLVLNSKGKQVERIIEYGVLAAWLTDLGLSQMHAQGRQAQGLGYTNMQSVPISSKHLNTFVNAQIGGFDGSTQQPSLVPVVGHSAVFPTQNANAYISRTGIVGNKSIPPYSKTIMGKNIKGHINSANTAWLHSTSEASWQVQYNPYKNTPPINQNAVQTSIKAMGYVKNLRAQYVESIQSTNFTDSTSSRPSYQINLNEEIFSSGSVNQQYQNGKRYMPTVPNTINYAMNLWTNQAMSVASTYKGSIQNTTSIHGFSSLYSPNFCKGVRQPFISATVPQCQMKNGKILPTKIPIKKKIFKIPLISAIIGILIPQDQFVLLPIKALNQLEMEIVLDNYAMFTSGYNDISEYDDAGMMMQQNRAFKVRRFQYVMHTYSFANKQVQDYIMRSLSTRIVINSQMWQLANQYTLAKGCVQNNHFITCTSQSLGQIVILFIPNDYQKYSFCRKHFRLSNNIVKFQLRDSTQYYPPQPLLGNGGNPIQIDDLDNSIFLQQIHWSNNFMFNKQNPAVRINQYNFAINDRCYDPTNTQTYYSSSVFSQQASHQWKNSSINNDTALGMPWVHENRYVGKAGYVFSFQPHSHSLYHLNGLNCQNIAGFQVMLATHPQDVFPRDQTMFIFTRSNAIVSYTDQGINIFGR